METVMIRHAIMEVRFVIALLILFMAAALLATDAGAASARGRVACASDYFAHCGKFPPNSQATRDCMHDVGDKLSKRCVNALVADGEVPDSDLAEHVASKHDEE
jgi:hypothetical protein